MTRKPFTVMAITASHNRIGFCFLIDKQPMDWQLAHHASKSPELTYEKAAQWFAYYQPDIIVTEDLNGSLTKGKKAQRLILAIKEAALLTDAQHIECERVQPYANKYEQIDRLCAEFPQMSAVAPKRRRIFDNEPAATTIFECLVLAKQLQS
ncbi:hypothetical protein [Planktotalea sp.]|uniref:hypothetical protein n=1 Tax=Planktotalea sp. TaxID=2029877 RepID=UPI003D6B84C1